MNTQTENLLRPSGNFYRVPEGCVVELEMPGVPREGLEVQVENGRLIVRGRRVPASSSGRELFRESVSGEYRREFRLDPSVDPAAVSAELRDGVLTVCLPDRESVRPRRIEVA